MIADLRPHSQYRERALFELAPRLLGKNSRVNIGDRGEPMAGSINFA